MTLRIEQDQLLSSDVLVSAALILILLAARVLVGHAIGKTARDAPLVQRRWNANIRNLLLLIGVLGIVMIWAPQLRTFALSLTAVAVAIVVATKELILCLSGSALRTFTRAYSVGDRIEVGGTRGEVIDHNLLVTTLREFEAEPGSFSPTGRVVVVPNSLLFGSPTRIESRSASHVLHRFAITLEPDVNVFHERAAIERLAAEIYTSVEPAAGGAYPQTKRQEAELPDSGPLQIRFGTNDTGKYRLDIALFASVDAVDRLQNEMTCAIGGHLHQLQRG